MSIIQIALRGFQFLMALLIISLIGNVIADAFAGNPASINFAMVAVVVSWISILIGIAAAFVGALAIPVLLWASDAVSMVLCFIAGVVLAANLHVHSCGNKTYLRTNHMTNGSHNMSKRCHELQASTAFFWFLFAAFAASIFMTFANRGSSTSIRRKGLGV